MSYTKQLNEESITYCSDIRIKGHESTKFFFDNTIKGRVLRVGKTPEEIVTDGAITEEESVEVARILQKTVDFYNPDKD